MDTATTIDGVRDTALAKAVYLSSTKHFMKDHCNSNIIRWAKYTIFLMKNHYAKIWNRKKTMQIFHKQSLAVLLHWIWKSKLTVSTMNSKILHDWPGCQCSLWNGMVPWLWCRVWYFYVLYSMVLPFIGTKFWMRNFIFGRSSSDEVQASTIIFT